MPGRDSELTPVEPFAVSVSSPPALTAEQWQGLALRHDALLGRPPGFLGPNDPGAPGLVMDVRKIVKILGRMPGENGIDDAGDGISAHVFEQRRKASFATKSALTGVGMAAVALLVAVLHLATAYADAQTRRIEVPAPAAGTSVPVALPPAGR